MEKTIDYAQIQSSKERIDAIRNVISIWFSKSRSVNSGYTSYSLKHDIENYLGRNRNSGHFIGGYVSNDEVKLAMKLEGFNSAPSYPNSPNEYFNIPMLDYVVFNAASSPNPSLYYRCTSRVIDRLKMLDPDSRYIKSGYGKVERQQVL